jgi:hypothetical protein
MSLVFHEGSVADLTAASADVQSVICLAESELSALIPDLASGDVAGAAADSLGAADLLIVLSPHSSCSRVSPVRWASDPELGCVGKT